MYVMGDQPDANRGALITVIRSIGQHTFRQTERQIRIHGVSISIKADALEVFFRKIVSVGPVVRQPQSCLTKNLPSEWRMGPAPTLTKSNLHRHSFATTDHLSMS